MSASSQRRLANDLISHSTPATSMCKRCSGPTLTPRIVCMVDATQAQIVVYDTIFRAYKRVAVGTRDNGHTHERVRGIHQSMTTPRPDCATSHTAVQPTVPSQQWADSPLPIRRGHTSPGTTSLPSEAPPVTGRSDAEIVAMVHAEIMRQWLSQR